MPSLWRTGDDVNALNGKAHRPGVYQCRLSRAVHGTVKTVFERSKVPLSKWLAALFMMTASKKGVSAHQIHRSLGISVTNQLGSFAIASVKLCALAASPRWAARVTWSRWTKLISVVAQGLRQTFRARAGTHKSAVLTLVQRGGSARSFHVDGNRLDDIVPVFRANIVRETAMIREAWFTVRLARVRQPRVGQPRGGRICSRDGVPTNTVEGYYSIFKRGMKGVYQHCSEKHLHRYLAEFDFRYNNRAALGFNDLMLLPDLVSAMKTSPFGAVRRSRGPESPEAKSLTENPGGTERAASAGLSTVEGPFPAEPVAKGAG